MVQSYVFLQGMFICHPFPTNLALHLNLIGICVDVFVVTEKVHFSFEAFGADVAHARVEFLMDLADVMGEQGFGHEGTVACLADMSSHRVFFLL